MPEATPTRHDPQAAAPVGVPDADINRRIRPFTMRMRPGWAFAKGFFRWGGALYWRMEIRHAERVPLEGPLLIVPTHGSSCDPPLLGAALPRETYFLARESLFKGVMAPILRYFNTYPIRLGGADREAIRACRSILEAGWALTFYPEGTRTPDGSLGALKSGWAMILDGTPGVPYLPVNLQDSYRVMNRRQSFPRPAKVVCTFGEPRLLPEKRDGERARQYYERCNAQLLEDFRKLKVRE